MDKKKQIIKIIHEFSYEIDSLNEDELEPRYESMAEEIVKLFAIPVVSNNEVYFCNEQPKRDCRFRLGEKCTSIGDCPHKNTEVAVCRHATSCTIRPINHVCNKNKKCFE